MTLYKSQVVFNYNFNKLLKSIPTLKKSSTFIDIKTLITFNDFSSRSINNNNSKFSYAFSKYLERLFDRVKPTKCFKAKPRRV